MRRIIAIAIVTAGILLAIFIPVIPVGQAPVLRERVFPHPAMTSIYQGFGFSGIVGVTYTLYWYSYLVALVLLLLAFLAARKLARLVTTPRPAPAS